MCLSTLCNFTDTCKSIAFTPRESSKRMEKHFLLVLYSNDPMLLTVRYERCQFMGTLDLATPPTSRWAFKAKNLEFHIVFLLTLINKQYEDRKAFSRRLGSCLIKLFTYSTYLIYFPPSGNWYFICYFIKRWKKAQGPTIWSNRVCDRLENVQKASWKVNVFKTF